MKENFAKIAIFIIILNIYMIQGMAGIAIERDTGVKVNNYINHFGNEEKTVQMLYSIKTPKIIHYDLVLALDSSGSFEESSSQHEAIIRDIPLFLEQIPKDYPDAYFNVSIISWDDNVDFIYNKERKFNNTGSQIKLTPINDLINETKKNLDRYYICKQSEQTDLSIPIKFSLDILNANKPQNTYGTKQIIMLIVGNGEFKACNENLMKEAKNATYIVGLDIRPGSELEDHLISLVSNNTTLKTPQSHYYYERQLLRYTNIPVTREFVKSEFEQNVNDSLSDALKKHFRNIMSQSVAENIGISDQLYCYYEPDLNSLKIVNSRAGSIEQGTINAEAKKENEPMDIKIEIPELLPNSVTNISFNIMNTFDPMSLPVTGSESKGPITVCSSIKPLDAIIKYKWLINGVTKGLILNKPDHKNF